jgi:hypothetical protein
VLKYFESFDLAAIARTRDGRLVATRNPAGHSEAWWGRATDLGPVLERARADHGDISKAAAALRVKLVPHADALQRTETIVARLDARVAHAQQSGDLGFVNRECKRRWLQAQAEGRSFPPYRVVQSRLRAALAEVAAGRAAPGIVARVLDDRLQDPQ